MLEVNWYDGMSLLARILQNRDTRHPGNVLAYGGGGVPERFNRSPLQTALQSRPIQSSRALGRASDTWESTQGCLEETVSAL